MPASGRLELSRRFPCRKCQSRSRRVPLQDAEVDWLEEKFSGIGAAAAPTPDVSAETWLRLQVVTQRHGSVVGGWRVLPSACVAVGRAQPHCEETRAAVSFVHQGHQQQQRLRLACAGMQQASLQVSMLIIS